MKAVKDFDKVDVSERKTLPIGGYVCVINKAEVVEYDGKDGGKIEKLEISFDIAEGEQKDFYADDYRAQTAEDKKWRGKKQLYVPLDDGSEKDEWTKKTLKRFTNAVEDSNNGYHWDWDEKKLTGKIVGIIFRNEEWEWNEKSGWSVRPFGFTSADKIRNGEFKVPEDKPLKNKSAAAVKKSPDVSFEIDDSDLPF